MCFFRQGRVGKAEHVPSSCELPDAFSKGHLDHTGVGRAFVKPASARPSDSYAEKPSHNPL